MRVVTSMSHLLLLSMSLEQLELLLESQNIPEKFPKEFFKEKWILHAQKNWDIFYKLNATNFFKDRHWLTREFPILSNNTTTKETSRRHLLEVGCGVGNLVFPLSSENPNLFIHCCDFSPRAIQMLTENNLYDPHRIHAFQADITIPAIISQSLPHKVDIVSAIFCLSAIPPSKLSQTLQNIADALKQGGSFIMRDYAQGDSAQLRFKAQNVISIDDSFYVRHDHTFSVFFSPEKIVKECANVGLQVVECGVVEKVVVNRKKELNMNRRFVQGSFIKI